MQLFYEPGLASNLDFWYSFIMKQEINDFLKSQSIAVITVMMPDGSPHSASIHYAHNDDLWFFFGTAQATLKSDALHAAEAVKASLVIGFDQATMRTLQLHGEARLLNPNENDLFTQVYSIKFPHVPVNNMDPKNVYFVFTPTWWRYSDFKHPDGKLVLSSAD